MKVYIAGPMTGLYEFNFPAFFQAEADLKLNGHECFNPARNDVENYGIDVTGTQGRHDEIPNFDLRQALSDDTQFILHEAEAVFMLSGWERSSGACAEHALAKAIGLQIFYQSSLLAMQLSNW